MALLVRVMIGPFGDLFEQWQQIIVLISIASMVLGAFAAINQTNIKRLMAYSSIGHMGYALVGLAAGTEAGVRGDLVYLAIYLVMNVGTFACILCMRQDGRMVERIDDLKGPFQDQPADGPGLGDLDVLHGGHPAARRLLRQVLRLPGGDRGRALHAGGDRRAGFSVVGAFYYVRIVKLMYFDEPAEAFDRPIGGGDDG